MEDETKDLSRRRLVTLKQLAKTPGYGCFTEPALRHLVFNAEDRLSSSGKTIKGNGLSTAIIRLGRRILLDLDAFDTWLDSHRDHFAAGR